MTHRWFWRVVLAAILIIVDALLGPETREAALRLPDFGFGRVPSPTPGAAPGARHAR